MYSETKEKTNFIALDIDGKGTIVIGLNEVAAPITVENFKKLVSKHFYDGIIFHRVIKGFMIQAGDPTGTGRSGSKDAIKGEFKSNGVPNELSHVRGVISMARTSEPDSATSQFFICHQDSTFLDGNYAAFGKVVSGIEVVDKIAECATGINDRPVISQRISRAYFVK